MFELQSAIIREKTVISPERSAPFYHCLLEFKELARQSSAYPLSANVSDCISQGQLFLATTRESKNQI